MNILKKIPGFIFEISAIIIISISLAFLYNHYREKPVQIDETKSIEKNINEISIEDSMNMFKNGETLFIDAREESDFNKGHIKNSINIPAEDANSKAINFLNRYKNKNTPIVVYCDGEECDLSLKTSKFLNSIGYNDVNILVNGWSLWKKQHPDLVGQNDSDKKSESATPVNEGD